MISRAIPAWWGLVALIVVQPGCEGHRTLDLTGGSVVGQGGALEEEPSTGGSAGEPDEEPPVALIDDFFDCDGFITTTSGREGSWYYFAEPAVNLFRVDYDYGLPVHPSFNTIKCGIYLTGNCEDCTSAGVGFELADEPWDLSGYSGIRVSFESTTSLWAVVVTSDGNDSGYSEYVELPATNGTSEERVLSFDDILPGTDFLGLTYAREVQFTVGEGDRGSFAFGIHRVELIE